MKCSLCNAPCPKCNGKLFLTTPEDVRPRFDDEGNSNGSYYYLNGKLVGCVSENGSESACEASCLSYECKELTLWPEEQIRRRSNRVRILLSQIDNCKWIIKDNRKELKVLKKEIYLLQRDLDNQRDLERRNGKDTMKKRGGE